jgi:hypothetical protein
MYFLNKTFEYFSTFYILGIYYVFHMNYVLLNRSLDYKIYI